MRSRISSHVANDAAGNDARLVPDERQAFTQASYNAIALTIEQIDPGENAAWPSAQMRNTAHWITHWSTKYGIPIQHSTSHGACQPQDLGLPGNSHDYPLDEVLAIAPMAA